MIVKRQVVANEVHTAFDQTGDALVPNTGDPRFFALPEPAVVHKNGVGALSGGRFDEIKRGGDAGHQTFDVAAALHLQAVGRVVAVRRRIENAVEQLNQFTNMHVGTNLGERPA